jgi:hypothetical protein
MTGQVNRIDRHEADCVLVGTASIPGREKPTKAEKAKAGRDSVTSFYENLIFYVTEKRRKADISLAPTGEGLTTIFRP